ncbi:MAG: hypothetical protein R2831_10190 [Chitinophagaceae bacterium]
MTVNGTTDLNIGTNYVKDIYIRSTDHHIGIGTSNPATSAKVTIQADTILGEDGIHVPNTVSGINLYATKSGAWENIYVNKSSTASSTPSIYVELATLWYGQRI